MGARSLLNPLTVVAVCAKCGSPMREKADLGAAMRAPLGRIWVYQCDGCGRRKTFVSPTSPIEDAVAQFGESALGGVA